MVSSVSFWGGDTTRVSGSDEQMLVNYFHRQLVAELGKKFEIVNKPGPGVLKLDVALMDAQAATPGLRSVSMLVPQAHMLSNLKYLATGTFPFVGAAQGAAKLTDSPDGTGVRGMGRPADRRRVGHDGIPVAMGRRRECDYGMVEKGRGEAVLLDYGCGHAVISVSAGFPQPRGWEPACLIHLKLR